jgi:glycosyltransferase involved in cell wall biosynthesis
MRIAQIVASLEVGGLERLAVDLAFEQKAAGHSPVIICVALRGPLAAEAERKGIPVFVIRKKLGFSPRALWILSRLLRRLRVDLVHTHNAPIHHYGALAAHLAGIRAVVNTQHGIGSLRVDRGLSRIFHLTMPLTRSVVFVSEETRREYISRRAIPERKTSTIRNGIPLSRFSEFRAQPGSRYPKVVFGTVGRLVPAKDHIGLICAFALVKLQLPAAELRIAGEGPLRQEIEARVQSLGLSDAVHLRGEILDVPRFLADLDVFVLSSVTEAMPIAILEAMAVGLPVVSTRVGGIAEVAPDKEVAEYCSPSDPHGLAEALLYVAKPDRMRSMGSLAARHATATLGLQRTWRAYEHLFLRLLDGSRGKPTYRHAHSRS